MCKVSCNVRLVLLFTDRTAVNDPTELLTTAAVRSMITHTGCGDPVAFEDVHYLIAAQVSVGARHTTPGRISGGGMQ